MSDEKDLIEELKRQVSAAMKAHDAMAASLDKERTARLLAEENLELVRQERDQLLTALNGGASEEAPF